MIAGYGRYTVPGYADDKTPTASFHPPYLISSTQLGCQRCQPPDQSHNSLKGRSRTIPIFPLLPGQLAVTRSTKHRMSGLGICLIIWYDIDTWQSLSGSVRIREIGVSFKFPETSKFIMWKEWNKISSSWTGCKFVQHSKPAAMTRPWQRN